jgi:hypothetical protein
MKKITLILAAVFAMSTMAFADNHETPAAAADHGKADAAHGKMEGKAHGKMKKAKKAAEKAKDAAHEATEGASH